uniref:Phosphoinositide 3-kinase regulatory subunit 5 n=1 Tax=Neolamprologus brichardi TaxID=32507 RepID=A0A3Q4FXY6_NEOBR
MQTLDQSSCTEDRIQHVLERCLSHLGVDTPDTQLWKAGLCINRWSLEELVKRDPHNFLILLQQILRKTKEVLEQCQYELVVPLSLLFSSTLLRAPYLPANSGVLQDANLLFHGFLSWPEPCSSAAKRLLNVIQQELRAPGLSFQRLVRTEQGISHEIHGSKTITVLLVSPDDDVPTEVQSVSEQLSASQHCSRDVTITLILHSFQAALGTKHDLQELHKALQSKQPEELDQILQSLTESMEMAASAADLGSAREGILQRMERLKESLYFLFSSGAVDIFTLPFPKCHKCHWENDNFDVLKHILGAQNDMDLSDCFLKTGLDDDDNNDTSFDEEEELEGNKDDAEFQSHRISTASSSSRDSGYSLSSSWSVPSGSSGVESGEETTQEDIEERPDSQPKPRKKPKKKSRSLLGFSLLFKPPRSPRVCRRVQSMAYHKDFERTQTHLKPSKVHPLHESPDLVEAPTLVKVVVFGGDREAGRLARAYSDLHQKESKCPQLTKVCKLQFYFVPTKRRSGSPGGGHTPTEEWIGVDDCTTDIAHMLGIMDPWYERNVLSLLSLSSDVLSQAASKDDSVSHSNGGTEQLPLLADLVLYYCRHADQPVLVQLYQVELTLVGGERRREVFIQSLELGHTAGTRAVKAMGAASKRFGIDEEREAVPLTLSLVAISGRSQWINKEIMCTSINLHKQWRTPQQLGAPEEAVLQVQKGLQTVSEVKVDKMQVNGRDPGTTFAVCLDQDEKKFIQSVTRCEVSLCCKPGSGLDWRTYQPLLGQVQPLHPSYCSMLCLPITSFSSSYP